MDDDCGSCDDTSTTVLTYILRKAKWIEKVFFLFHISSLNACFQIFSFCFFLSFLFSIALRPYCLHLQLPFLPSSCSRSFSPNCATLVSTFLSLILSFFKFFYFFWRFCEPQYVNLFSWRNQNVRFVTSWQVTSLSNNYLTSYTCRPRQDPSTASNRTVFARTFSNKRSMLAATVHPRFPLVMALNSHSTRQAILTCQRLIFR